MKNLLIIFLVICCPFFVNGQDLEVAGKAKIETMDSDNTANNVVVRLADGTLAIRDASTIPNPSITVYDTIYQVLSISNDTIYLSYGGFVKLPADADTQLSESEVEGFIEGDETSFTSWDKDASDDLQLGTTATTALAGDFTEVDGSTTNEIQMLTVSNDSIYISGGNGIKLPASGGATHYVGELMGVGGIDGVVFYVDHTGQHGLICSSHDIAESAGDSTMSWDNGMSQVLTNPTSQWDGETNTTTILDVESGSIAVSKCDTYSTNGTSAGDWYLPAIGELSKMWHATYEISKALDVDNAFVPTDYWSSLEFNSSLAWLFAFGNGYQFYDNKNVSLRVRAVRAF